MAPKMLIIKVISEKTWYFWRADINIAVLPGKK